ncbi:MAG: pilin [Minisyncoccia bacterium]
MTRQKKISVFLIFTLSAFWVFFSLKFNFVLAKTCSEKGGYCYPEDICKSLNNLGYYIDSSATGCPIGTVCCVVFSPDNNDSTPKGLPPEIQSPTSVIPYEFETGIPGIAKKGESLQRMTLAEFVKLLIRYIFKISGILAFIMIVYGGILYLVSGGNPQKQKSALEYISAAIIGLIFLFAFWLILNTINPDILRISNLANQNSTTSPPSPPSPPPSSSPPPSPPQPKPNHSQETINNAKKLLSLHNSGRITISFAAAQRDLNDVINNKCTDPIANSNYDDANCITLPKFPECPTINGDLIKALLSLPDKAKETAKTVAQNTPYKCSDIIEISPFISDHYYCEVPNSSHKDGKAVDVTLNNISSNITPAECTAALARVLCPNYTGSILGEDYKLICRTQLNGVTIEVWAETGRNQPHLHLRLP